MNRPLVSIVIPVYNVSAYIGRCLQSALAQTYPSIEYVLIDDAGSDGSMAVAEKLLANHPRREAVKILYNDVNCGLSATRNRGVKASKGDYIYFLDSDDEIPDYCIETLVNISGGEIDIAIGRMEIAGGSESAYPTLKLAAGVYRGETDVLGLYLKKEWYEMACNKLINKRLFDEENCWFEEGIVHEDTLWSFRTAVVSRSLAVTDKITYIYHIHKKSITRNKSEKNILDFYRVIREIIGISKEQGLFGRYKSLIPYLDSMRIYFLKNLNRFSGDSTFREAQREKINRLFREEVRPFGREPLLSKAKAMYLFILSFCYRNGIGIRK